MGLRLSDEIRCRQGHWVAVAKSLPDESLLAEIANCERIGPSSHWRNELYWAMLTERQERGLPVVTYPTRHLEAGPGDRRDHSDHELERPKLSDVADIGPEASPEQAGSTGHSSPSL